MFFSVQSPWYHQHPQMTVKGTHSQCPRMVQMCTKLTQQVCVILSLEPHSAFSNRDPTETSKSVRLTEFVIY